MSKRNKLPGLADTIETILNGTPEEKAILEGKHFYIADTPQFMKKLKDPINGQFFTARYGVISRHKSKDDDHNLTKEEWLELCDAITKPFIITKYRNGHNLYTTVKHNDKTVMVGIELKGQKVEVNAIKTVFGTNELKGEKILYKTGNLTPEQEIHIGKTCFANDLPGASLDTNLLSSSSAEMSSEL